MQEVLRSSGHTASSSVGFTTPVPPASLLSPCARTVFPLGDIFLNTPANNRCESTNCLPRETSALSLRSRVLLKFYGFKGGWGGKREAKLQKKRVHETISPHAQLPGTERPKQTQNPPNVFLSKQHFASYFKTQHNAVNMSSPSNTATPCRTGGGEAAAERRSPWPGLGKGRMPREQGCSAHGPASARNPSHFCFGGLGWEVPFFFSL